MIARADRLLVPARTGRAAPAGDSDEPRLRRRPLDPARDRHRHRDHGAAFEVPDDELSQFDGFLAGLGYAYDPQTKSPAYEVFFDQFSGEVSFWRRCSFSVTAPSAASSVRITRRACLDAATGQEVVACWSMARRTAS